MSMGYVLKQWNTSLSDDNQRSAPPCPPAVGRLAFHCEVSSGGIFHKLSLCWVSFSRTAKCRTAQRWPARLQHWLLTPITSLSLPSVQRSLVSFLTTCSPCWSSTKPTSPTTQTQSLRFSIPRGSWSWSREVPSYWRWDGDQGLDEDGQTHCLTVSAITPRITVASQLHPRNVLHSLHLRYHIISESPSADTNHCSASANTHN